MTAVGWSPSAADAGARTGTLTTPHGTVATPAFMPVGTRGTVKTIDVADLERLGAQIVLANTYHLMLRPGEGVVAGLGELHGFMAWSGPILTDSGGFQILSLDPRIEEQGVRFRSTYDGTSIDLSPEDAVRIQETLGSDIAMVLDVPVHLPSTREKAELAMGLTLRWAERSARARTRSDRALFGIVQGGADRHLRARSAAETARLGFDGYGIGGLAVGESPEERNRALEATIPELPTEAPRYVMGLGDTAGLLDAIARGADLFDCVIPTRLARHGKATTIHGDLSMRRAEWTEDGRPVAEGCNCFTCTTYSRGYLRHLFTTKERLGERLLTIHNLHYLFDLMTGARAAITAGTFEEFHADRLAQRSGGGADMSEEKS